MLPPTAPAAELPPIGHRYEVEGRRLFLVRSGAGGPPVVFFPGGGMFSLGYYNIHCRTAELTTSVLYDRAGTGWSDSVALPRSVAAVVQELRTLLRVADIPGPYVLVGHSLGGLYARRFAQLFPADVAGLLLLDPAHEDYPANEPEVARRAAAEWKDKPMPELSPEQIEGYRPILNAMYAEWPPEIRAPLIERHLNLAQVAAGMREVANVDALYEEMRRGGTIPAVPVIVYTAMGIDASQTVFSTEEVVRAQNEAKLATNSAFARSVPGAESRVLEDVGHLMIHTQRQDAVLQGIRDVLERVAGLTTLGTGSK
ncbi:MAG: alpha/beta hydrolase [Gemmatimonadota bacterium]